MKRKSVPALIAAGAMALMFLQSCGKGEKEKKDATDEVGLVTADNPNAVISPTLRLIKGRWVEEIPSTIKPDPATMRIYAVANNTLSGRFLVAGGYQDQGVAITITQDSDTTFTLVLKDDELRPHQWIPAERVFKGTWDVSKSAFDFKSDDGESIHWDMPGATNPDVAWKAIFTSTLYTCKLIPVGQPPEARPPRDGGGSWGGGGPQPGPGPGPNPGPAPEPAPDPDDEDSTPLLALSRPTILETPTPSPTSTPPPQMGETCGMLSRFEVPWARRSGGE